MKISLIQAKTRVRLYIFSARILASNSLFQFATSVSRCAYSRFRLVGHLLKMLLEFVLFLSRSRMQPRPFELLNYYFSFVSCTVSLKMPNFGDTAQENTSGVSDGNEWPVVFLFVWFFFLCVVLSSLRSQRDTLDTRGFFLSYIARVQTIPPALSEAN